MVLSLSVRLANRFNDVPFWSIISVRDNVEEEYDREVMVNLERRFQGLQILCKLVDSLRHSPLG